jgi:hypothetical protein
VQGVISKVESPLSHEQQMSMFFENSCHCFVTTDADYASIESGYISFFGLVVSIARCVHSHEFARIQRLFAWNQYELPDLMYIIVGIIAGIGKLTIFDPVSARKSPISWAIVINSTAM